MACTEKQKEMFGTHKLSEEAEDWWDNACQRMQDKGTEITQHVFITNFLDKYFPENVRSKKEIELLELKQGNFTVAEYVAMFEELVLSIL